MIVISKQTCIFLPVQIYVDCNGDIVWFGPLPYSDLIVKFDLIPQPWLYTLLFTVLSENNG